MSNHSTQLLELLSTASTLSKEQSKIINFQFEQSFIQEIEGLRKESIESQNRINRLFKEYQSVCLNQYQKEQLHAQRLKQLKDSQTSRLKIYTSKAREQNAPKRPFSNGQYDKSILKLPKQEVNMNKISTQIVVNNARQLFTQFGDQKDPHKKYYPRCASSEKYSKKNEQQIQKKVKNSNFGEYLQTKIKQFQNYQKKMKSQQLRYRPGSIYQQSPGKEDSIYKFCSNQRNMN